MMNLDRQDQIPGILAWMITLLVALSIITPYFFEIPTENINLITQAQTTLWNGWMMALAYYYGSSKNQAKAAETIAAQAKTAQVTGAALAASLPGVPGEVKLSPGDEVVVAATGTDGVPVDPARPQA